MPSRRLRPSVAVGSSSSFSTASSSSSSSSLLTDMLLIRYSRRSLSRANRAAAAAAATAVAAVNGDDPMDAPRTWTSTDRDYDDTGKKSHSCHKDIHPILASNASSNRLVPSFKQEACDLMERFDKVMLEGNNDMIPKTAAPSSAKWTEPAFTTKPSTRQLPKASSAATCKDIVVPANVALERFVPPSKPMFTFSSKRQESAKEHASESGSDTFNNATNRPSRPRTTSRSKTRSGRHLTSMAGMTKRDILLSSNKAIVDTTRHEPVLHHVHQHQPIAAPSKDGMPDFVRKNDSIEALVDSFYNEQTAPQSSVSALPHHSCDIDINDNDAESVRLAIEEQENEMLLMALSLSLHDGDRRHVEEASSGTDSEWYVKESSSDDDMW